MTVRTIVYVPDPRLRIVSKSVEVFDDALQTLIDDMFETMYSVHGVGLAAPQIGINLQLSVIDIIGDKKQQLVLINPVVTPIGPLKEFKEGCLSVPGSYNTLKRASRVRLNALDRHGKPYEMEAEDLLGECFQHEVDHLHGKLYIDYLSPIKRQLARKKVDKFVREQQT